LRLGEQWYRDGNTLGHELEFTGAMASPGDAVFEVHVPLLPNYGCSPADIFGWLPTGAYSFWLRPDGYTPPAPYGGGPIEGDAQVHLYAVPRSPA
jgi:hypothetical protein